MYGARSTSAKAEDEAKHSQRLDHLASLETEERVHPGEQQQRADREIASEAGTFLWESEAATYFKPSQGLHAGNEQERCRQEGQERSVLTESE